MKWWQKKVKGWIVPFWNSETPIISKRAHDIGLNKLAKSVRRNNKCICDENTSGASISGWCNKHKTHWI